MTRKPDIQYRQLKMEEIEELVRWAEAEGWNPGRHDAEMFRSVGEESFLGIELNGELVGGGAIVAYGREAGFMGLFIVKPEWRSRGLGRDFWYHRRDLLQSRLEPGAWIAMDGVFAMQPFYAKGGFVFTHRNLRMEGVGQVFPEEKGVLALSEVPFEDVEKFDRRFFLAPRSEFLRQWITQPEGKALASVSEGKLEGYGVIRRCTSGYKIGPLFATSSEVAEHLFRGLAGAAVGKPLFLDVPEINADAMALAARHGMKEVFGCARMVLGPVPSLPWDSIYGVTTFELG